jgi:hypothetical protein
MTRARSMRLRPASWMIHRASIGLAVPAQPIGPWSRRTGAPKASATGRDRNPESAHALLTRPSDTGRNSAGKPPVGEAKAHLEGPVQRHADTPERHSNDSLPRGAWGRFGFIDSTSERPEVLFTILTALEVCVRSPGGHVRTLAARSRSR